MYFLGYWYPQVAVYDDVSGWVAEPYTGQAEFYMGQAHYDVHLTVPRHWLVGATGELQNPNEVLSARSRRRLRRARRTGEVVPILKEGERGTGAATKADGPTSTWHFRAKSVRDFAWGTSDQYLWDATQALVPPPSNRFSDDGSVRRLPSSAPASSDADTVLIHSFFRPTEAAAAWQIGGARYTRNAVEALSRYLRSRELSPNPPKSTVARQSLRDNLLPSDPENFFPKRDRLRLQRVRTERTVCAL